MAAFKKSQERLENDVGEIINLVIQVRKNKDWCPWWALVRMLLPIAEAMGDLIFKESKTSQNLVRLLEEELGVHDDKYRKTAALIVLLYRHSLAHQDELRTIRSGQSLVRWKLSFGQEVDHLKTSADPSDRNNIWLQFDITQFYKDLVQLSRVKAQVDNKAADERYSQWLMLDLDSREKELFAKAKTEIEGLIERSVAQEHPGFTGVFLC